MQKVSLFPSTPDIGIFSLSHFYIFGESIKASHWDF